MSNFVRILERMLRDPGMLMAVLATVTAFVLRFWHGVKRRALDVEGRNWPAIDATIDVVSVVEVLSREETIGYDASLTYFYRNPELQVGEYVRPFPLKAAAENWVEQFKSRHVVVHVNPKKPAESVLLEDDLLAITIQPAPALNEALRMEKVPELQRGYRLLAAFSEIVGMAGLAASAVMFCICLRRGGERTESWILWSLGGALAFTAVSMYALILRAEDEDEYRSFSLRYSIWCPAWMRWALTAFGGLFAVLWLTSKIDPGLARYLLLGTGSLFPLIFMCWGLLVTTGFHLAVVRSQMHRRPVYEEASSRVH